MTDKTGGYVYPRATPYGGWGQTRHQAMVARFVAAEIAYTGMHREHNAHVWVVETAFDYADAVLAEEARREKESEVEDD